MRTRHQIVIYLVTQDFYNLSREHKKFKPISDYLIRECELKNILIGYSFPLIFELLRQYDEQHKPERLRIARFVKKLCGNNAFPYPTDLANGAKFPNDGVWMPATALETFAPGELEKRIISSFRTALSEDPRVNRKLRRKLGSRSGLKDAMNSVPMRPLAKTDFPDIPVSDEILNGRFIQRYIEGKISSHALSNALTKWLTDPEHAIQIWYEYANLNNPLEDIISSAWEKIEIGILGLRDAIDKYQHHRKKAKEAQSELYRLIARVDLDESLRNKIRIPSIPKKFEPLGFSEALGKLGSDFGEGRSAQFACYLDALANGRLAPQRSDIGDLLHLIYLPDVDLMRCDKRMAHLMKSCSALDREKIVGSLTDLPARIEQLKSAVGQHGPLNGAGGHDSESSHSGRAERVNAKA